MKLLPLFQWTIFPHIRQRVLDLTSLMQRINTWISSTQLTIPSGFIRIFNKIEVQVFKFRDSVLEEPEIELDQTQSSIYFFNLLSYVSYYIEKCAQVLEKYNIDLTELSIYGCKWVISLSLF